VSDNLEALLGAAKKAVRDGEMQAFAQVLSLIERLGPKALKSNSLLNPPHVAFRVGITGPPGAGKSTLINGLIREFRRKKLRVGVVAVDPTSPISQGAILGDRIRYADHALDSGVFIRSLGTRGSLGGLSASAYLMVRAFDVCEFDIVLIETVGVGQVEVEVMNVADVVTVVLVPESGDSIQAMKAGIIEVADLFVVNKSDRPGAESLKNEIEASVAMSETGTSRSSQAKVLLTSAIGETAASGVAAVAAEIFKLQPDKKSLLSSRKSSLRLREEAKALMRFSLEAEASRRVVKIATPKDLLKMFK
jgi:LAO/AO transport system kinase